MYPMASKRARLFFSGVIVQVIGQGHGIVRLPEGSVWPDGHAGC